MRLTMKGRRGILLKMIAHAGAIDYQAIRIYYSGYPKSCQNRDLSFLTTHGYISKENQRDKDKLSYFYLTDKGKRAVLGSDSESVWDCAMYLSGNKVQKVKPITDPYQETIEFEDNQETRELYYQDAKKIALSKDLIK